MVISKKKLISAIIASVLVAFVASSACSGVMTRDPVVPAMFESKPVFWIVKELARRLELAGHFDFTIGDFRKA